jgi:hypothetical protein
MASVIFSFVMSVVVMAVLLLLLLNCLSADFLLLDSKSADSEHLIVGMEALSGLRHLYGQVAIAMPAHRAGGFYWGLSLM